MRERCPRCGGMTDKMLREELRRIKAELKQLRLSVASYIAKAAQLNKHRKGSNE